MDNYQLHLSIQNTRIFIWVWRPNVISTCTLTWQQMWLKSKSSPLCSKVWYHSSWKHQWRALFFNSLSWEEYWEILMPWEFTEMKGNVEIFNFSWEIRWTPKVIHVHVPQLQKCFQSLRNTYYLQFKASLSYLIMCNKVLISLFYMFPTK